MARWISSIVSMVLVSCLAWGFPLTSRRMPEGGIPRSFTADYDFEGIVGLSNCSGSLIQLENGRDSDFGLILTNGHCLEGGMPQPGAVVYGKASSRTFSLFNSQAQVVGRVNATRVVYSTMTKTDMTIYQLRETYSQIKANFGIRPLTLSPRHPESRQPMEVISGYWRRGYSCAVETFVSQLKEDRWTFVDSIRYTRPGCEVIGGTSGSPIVLQGSRTVIGVNNTGNEDGQRCTMNNPCEIDAHGNVSFNKGYSYGQETFWLYSCLNQNREVDLSVPGCQLPK